MIRWLHDLSDMISDSGLHGNMGVHKNEVDNETIIQLFVFYLIFTFRRDMRQ